MSALFLLLAGGTPDWVEIIVVVLLLFGGGIQAIIKKLRGEEGKPPTRAPRPSAEVKGGLERWRELARGDAHSEAPTIQREPIGAEVRRAPRPRRPQPIESAVPEPAPLPADSPWSELHDEDDFSDYAGEPGEADLSRRQQEARATEDRLVAGKGSRPARVRDAVPLRVRLRNRHEWRDAIVAAELLGRPVGMRRREELPGNVQR